ncbi:MAG: lactate utilization protein [Hyphomicrobiales bacterium]|nr:lactate utilization protein [Hyphomicrobiales bacterium]
MSGPDPRGTVLGAIRGALDVGDTDERRRATVQKRLERHPANLIPQQGRPKASKRIAQFTEKLEGQGATVARVKQAKDIPDVVAAYLRENNLPAKFRTGADPLLARIPWAKAPSLTRLEGRGEGSDAVAMSRAVTAAAETGTLFLTSGADNPTTLNFLPDTHIAVIRADDILGSYEDAWNSLRDTFGERTLPRTVNLISGPSRTADIEQTIVMGAHGPRRLHVIVLG